MGERVMSPRDPLEAIPTKVVDYIKSFKRETPDAPAEPNAGASTASGPAMPGERGNRYARAAIEGAIADYEDTPAGGGDTALFTACCRLIELENAAWTDVVVDWAELSRARVRRRERLGPGHGQSDADFWRVKASARTRVGDTPADPPKDLVMTVRGKEINFTPPLAASSEGDDVTSNATPSASAALMAEVLDTSELDDWPNPEYLVRGWLNMNTLCQMVGPPKSLKSFVALDLAAHVAMGWRWAGLDTRQGTVLYVVAEGREGFHKRVRAWEKHHGMGIKAGQLRALPRPVQARSKEWEALTQVCAALQPVLVIIDTQARVTVGIEENSATELGVFVERVEEIRRATDACVLVVHHSGRSGTHARGSSAIDGAVHTQLAVARSESAGGTKYAKVTAPLQKDEADDEGLDFEARVIEVGRDPEGGPITSLVLTPMSEAARLLDRDRLESLTELQTRLVGVLGECPAAGLTKAEVRYAVRTGLGDAYDPKRGPRRFIKAWDKLIKDKIISQIKGKERYRLTSQGIDGDQS